MWSRTLTTSCDGTANGGPKAIRRSTAAIVTDATLEIRSPLLAATVAIVVAALPILFLGGLFESFFLNDLSGAFVNPIVVSYVLAIVASLAVALIVTPALATLLLGRFPRSSKAPRPVAGSRLNTRERWTEPCRWSR